MATRAAVDMIAAVAMTKTAAEATEVVARTVAVAMIAVGAAVAVVVAVGATATATATTALAGEVADAVIVRVAGVAVVEDPGTAMIAEAIGDDLCTDVNHDA